VAGLIMNLLGAIPLEGEEVRYDDLVFVAERVQGRRIAKVLIRHLPPETEEDPTTEEPPAAREGTG
jgi:CBS domain containing-hemolysin-like protein